METTEAFAGLECLDCGERFDPVAAPGRCPGCGGILDAVYAYDRIDPEAITGGVDATGRHSPRSTADGGVDGNSMWCYDALLPFPRSAATTTHEGATPVVECPDLAAELGVGRVLLKDEGRNPAGTVEDRGLAVAVTAARQHGTDVVALPSTGDSGQSAAAYAARAGLEARVFVPTRAGFASKAMVNVHGADMTVVEGRFGEAVDAYEEAIEGEDWYGLRAFHTPYRHEGAKTWFYEVAAALGWAAPDAVVVPTGDGVPLVGAHKAATELRKLGIVAELPATYAVQPADCAPIVRAADDGRDRVEPWEGPDTICGGLEVADPTGGRSVLDAIADGRGGAIAVDDDATLEAACAAAAIEGVGAGTAAGATIRGAEALAAEGAFGPEETIVLLCPAAGTRDADVLRSHLMRTGT